MRIEKRKASVWYEDQGRDGEYELDLEKEYDLEDSAAILIEDMIGSSGILTRTLVIELEGTIRKRVSP